MRVAVVTPYFREARGLLESCVESVRAQSHPTSHILIADGEPQEWLSDLSAQHVVLGANHHDYGDTPRGIGSVSAISQGFEAIAYLDADNWYHPDHIASLVNLHQRTGAAVCSSGRNLHRLDGSLLAACPEVDGKHFVDTNCLFLTRAAFLLVPVWWSIPSDLHCIADRLMWNQILSRRISRAHSDQRTVAYRTAFEGHYRRYGETPPPGAKTGEAITAAMERLRSTSPSPPDH